MSDKNKEIKDAMFNMSVLYENGELPSDASIQRLSNLFYERDKIGKFDFEAAAVQRGIVQGMQLMRQIIESNK